MHSFLAIHFLLQVQSKTQHFADSCFLSAALLGGICSCCCLCDFSFRRELAVPYCPCLTQKSEGKWSGNKGLTGKAASGQLEETSWHKEPKDFWHRKSTMKKDATKTNKKVIWSIKMYHAEHCSQSVHLHSWWKSWELVFVLQKISGVCRLLCIQRYMGRNHGASVRISKQLSYLEPLCSKGSISLGLILSMQKLNCKCLENPHLPGPCTAGKCQLRHECCSRSHFHYIWLKSD